MNGNYQRPEKHITFKKCKHYAQLIVLAYDTGDGGAASENIEEFYSCMPEDE